MKSATGKQRRQAEPQTPHDALFKETFSKMEHARAMLRAVVPEDVGRHVDWASLKRRPGSFVDEGLREHHTDLLFAAKIGQRPAYFYLLFEHQSKAERWMLLRLLQYMVRIWREHLAAHPDATRLPLIIPVVLHHSETGWTCATAFEELIELEDDARAAVRYVPRFQIVLDDMSHVTDEQLRGRAITALAKLVLACLKHGRKMGPFLGNLPLWSNTLREVCRSPSGMRAFALVVRYIFRATEDLDPREVWALVKAANEPEVEEPMTTTWDLLVEWVRKEDLRRWPEPGEDLEKMRQEDRKRDLQEAARKGRTAVVLKQLRIKFGKLPAGTVARVRKASEAELDRWTERVLTAKSLAEVLDG